MRGVAPADISRWISIETKMPCVPTYRLLRISLAAIAYAFSAVHWLDAAYKAYRSSSKFCPPLLSFQLSSIRKQHSHSRLCRETCLATTTRRSPRTRSPQTGSLSSTSRHLSTSTPTPKLASRIRSQASLVLNFYEMLRPLQERKIFSISFLS